MFAVPADTIPHLAPAATHPALIARDLTDDLTDGVARWAHLLRYDPDRPAAALVERTGSQEVWLVGWLPGQGRRWHTHDAVSGAFTVVSGVLTERVARNGEVLAYRVEAGRTRVCGARHRHEVINDGPDPAVSVHVYRTATASGVCRFDPVTGRYLGPSLAAAR